MGDRVTQVVSPLKQQKQTLVAVSIVVAFLTICTVLVQRLQEVNEPHPSSVNRSAMEQSLSTDRVRVHVDEVFYVNQDFNAYIFTGKSEGFSSLQISPDGDELLSEKEFRLAYPS